MVIVIAIVANNFLRAKKYVIFSQFELPWDRKSWLLLSEVENNPTFGAGLSTLITENNTSQFVALLYSKPDPTSGLTYYPDTTPLTLHQL